MKFYGAECLDDKEQRAHIVSFTRSCRIVDGEGPKYPKQCWQHPESTGLTSRSNHECNGAIAENFQAGCVLKMRIYSWKFALERNKMSILGEPHPLDGGVPFIYTA